VLLRSAECSSRHCIKRAFSGFLSYSLGNPSSVLAELISS